MSFYRNRSLYWHLLLVHKDQAYILKKEVLLPFGVGLAHVKPIHAALYLYLIVMLQKCSNCFICVPVLFTALLMGENPQEY